MSFCGFFELNSINIPYNTDIYICDVLNTLNVTINVKNFRKNLCNVMYYVMELGFASINFLFWEEKSDGVVYEFAKLCYLCGNRIILFHRCVYIYLMFYLIPFNDEYMMVYILMLILISEFFIKYQNILGTYVLLRQSLQDIRIENCQN